MSRSSTPSTLRFEYLSGNLELPSNQSSCAFYQTSAIQSFWNGNYDGLVSVKQLLSFGNFGLGTFDGVDGELVFVEGDLYKVPSNGIPHRPTGRENCPFGVVANIDSGLSKIELRDLDYEKFKDNFLSIIKNQNLAYAFALQGIFSHVRYRSICKQKKPYQPFTEVVKQQIVFETTQEEGRIVGFWFPETARGLQLLGFHLHYISTDLKRGGHILDLSIKQANLQFQAGHTLRILT